MRIALIALVALAVVVFCIWMATQAARPERAAGDDDVPPDTTSDRFYRPAGPDAEDPPAP